MIEKKQLELLQFDTILHLLQTYCFSQSAKDHCKRMCPSPNREAVLPALFETNEMKQLLEAKEYFPSLEHENIEKELHVLNIEGSVLHQTQLFRLNKTTELINSLLRFLKGKKIAFPRLYSLASELQVCHEVTNEIQKVINAESEVKSSASHELTRIRKLVLEKRKESDRKFYGYIHELRKLGYLRENEESYFNGRRTLAVLVEFKSEVQGFVHDKSESGKTIFIEPAHTIAINNEVAELELDEQREINRLLRELCQTLRPFAGEVLAGLKCLTYLDFVKAKALFAIDLQAVVPELNSNFELELIQARHPILFLQNKRLNKLTVPLSLNIKDKQRVIVISGPNAGGKTIALKTLGLIQVMLQSGLLVPVNEHSHFCFFEKILIDLGDTQSIENELSTYSAKLKSMTSILNEVNESTLILMDEFGSGTDPELGSAIAEAVLESLVTSQTRGIITSHFSNVKLLAGKLNGACNASMLFDLEHLEPKFSLSIGEPGSSYTFEVAERIGFPKHLIQRAKEKVDKNKLNFNRVLAEVQNQKTRLEELLQKKEHEEFLMKIAKEKYHALFNTWQEKIEKERERKIELARLAEYGEKYLRLMDNWNQRKDRKDVLKRFIAGITAESKKQELLKKQGKLNDYAEKKIARLKPLLQVGSKVKVLNGNEIGIVEEIKDEKVFIKFGLMKMTVGIQNLVIAE